MASVPIPDFSIDNEFSLKTKLRNKYLYLKQTKN